MFIFIYLKCSRTSYLFIKILSHSVATYISYHRYSVHSPISVCSGIFLHAILFLNSSIFYKIYVDFFYLFLQFFIHLYAPHHSSNSLLRQSSSLTSKCIKNTLMHRLALKQKKIHKNTFRMHSNTKSESKHVFHRHNTID